MGPGVLATIVLIVAFGCFIAFLWATRKHFLVCGPMPPAMNWVTLLSFVGAAWFTARVSAFGVGPGAPYAIVLTGIALGLFCWTVKTTRVRRLPIAFADDLPDFIYESGPYRYIRHPFYMSYMLCWIGTSAATRGIWSWTVPVVMSAIYVTLARREERRFSTSRLAGAYDAYRRHTTMFIPTSFPRSAGGEGA